jgi:hypothetical protein
MISWLLRHYRERCRRLDRELLFPEMKNAAHDAAHYRRAVRLHIVSPAGRCWRVPYGELNQIDLDFIRSIYKELPPHA